MPVQTLEHPACVWDVAFLPNGDLVTACADFAARVWTSSPERVASADTIQVRLLAVEVGPRAGRRSACLPRSVQVPDVSRRHRFGASRRASRRHWTPARLQRRAAARRVHCRRASPWRTPWRSRSRAPATARPRSSARTAAAWRTAGARPGGCSFSTVRHGIASRRVHTPPEPLSQGVLLTP